MSATFLGVLAAPAIGAEGSATGGARPGVIPELSGVACAQGCSAHTPVRSARNTVRAHTGTVLRLKGNRLQTVQKVVFLGRPGTADDVLVSPARVGRSSVLVTVPATASSGRVLVTTADGSSSTPGGKVSIHRHAPSPQPPPPAAEATGTRSATLIWPVRGPITSKFGEDRGDHFHSGLDIAAPARTPIKAVADGTVIHAGWFGGYGNYTCVAHVTITTCYAHQIEYATTPGAKVKQGQVIGYVGNTGNSFGNHLHFEIRNGLLMSSTTVDPTKYLP